jgi:enhancer of mRNA-decapping protein 3
MLARAAQNLPSPSSPFIGDISNVPRQNLTQKLAAAAGQKPRPIVTQQVSTKPPAAQPAELASETINTSTARDASLKKKSKKPKRREPAVVAVADPPPTMNTEVSRNGNDMNVSVKRGKGWRNTPLLQPSPQPSTDAQSSKKGRRRRDQEQEFAQGDTTDIQDMGDFDFEGELKKFDKKQVFDEIRQGDTTADEDRLVSHNRIHRPGTYGGKNLHPTEPVLSPKLPVKASNDAGSTSDADTELDFPNGRSSSRHSNTRSVLNKKQPSRQNSQHVDARIAPHALLPLSATISNRSSSSLVSRSRHASSMAAISPRPDRSNTPPLSRSITDLATAAPEASPEPHFVIRPDMGICPTLLPGALDALELAAVETFGLSVDALTESAARCIAEAAIHLAEDNNRRRPSRTSTVRGSMTSSTILNQPPASSPAPSATPVIVVLAGDHAVGARALAAARHLVTHGFQIIAAETVNSTAETVNPQRRTQTNILRKMRAAGAPVRRGRWARAEEYIKHLPGPPTVIIDALLAGTPVASILQSAQHTPLAASADTSSTQHTEVRAMIDWANRSRAPVLSISVPSGVDGLSGLTTVVDGEPLAIRPARVLALGAPLSGLLRAMLLTGERWPVSLADVGINIALRKEEGLAFVGGGGRRRAAAWTVELEVADGVDEEETAESRIGRVR